MNARTIRWLGAAAVLVLVGLHARVTVGAQDAPAKSPLAFELNEVRKAWLYGDNATAQARLDSLKGDDRLRGLLPRWYAFLRATLALQRGETDAALEAFEPVLQKAVNASDTVRAARLLIAHGEYRAAAKLVRQGRVRGPNSMALHRFEAGLMWLQDDHEGALESYVEAIIASEVVHHPYASSSGTNWDSVKPWDWVEPELLAQQGKSETEVNAARARAARFQPEPFAGPCTSPVWYTTDLPGLERCVIEAAGMASVVESLRGPLDAQIERARKAQRTADASRGSREEREKLDKATRRQRWRALLPLRVVALADFLAGRTAEAETLTARGLSLWQEDVGLIDLQARILGRLGKAEEARRGPLSRLHGSYGLVLSQWGLLSNSFAQEKLDRIFEPARVLYQINEQGGLAQLEEARRSFGDPDDDLMVPQSVLGIWLYGKGETALARKYLKEASGVDGHDAAKGLQGMPAFAEFVLTGLLLEEADKPAGKSEPDGEGENEDEKEEEEEGEGEEEKEDEQKPPAHPLLELTPRIGSLLALTMNQQEAIRRLSNVDLWMRSSGIDSLTRAAARLQGGMALLDTILYGLSAKIAGAVTPEQLDALLSDESTQSKRLKSGADELAESINKFRTSRDWNLQRAIREKAAVVLGTIEARALLLRARLLQSAPSDLKSLGEWLDKHQGQIDLRLNFKTPATKEQTQRAKLRDAAGIPEVMHSGMLLDAAGCLARAGAYAEAAGLIWYNRNTPLGYDTSQRLLALAAALARKGGDRALAHRADLAAASLTAGGGRRNRYRSFQTFLPLEYGRIRKELLQFGSAKDVARFVENHIVPWAGAEFLEQVLKTSPELKDADRSLLMRNPAHVGVEGIFSDGVRIGNTAAIWRNWIKLLRNPETHASCFRLASWAIASDLPMQGSGYNYPGLTSTLDALMACSLLGDLYAAQAELGNQAAATKAKRVKLLIKRWGGDIKAALR